ncbi:hypothetical protein HPT27_07240 [Permianibacter sp. IMCC34836]|uniref:hypothetical protein n=1 Tax=Permianibacter fluminis TaxID=2738515 RepID=UPI0015516BAD|nr:hypothetical protein [Permianibacter fluminis]NQD36817.1 hypothetical protein [Permianibacter fluminis]
MTSQNDDITDNDITDNDIPAVDITATAARSTTASLLHLIQQQWSTLLAGEKLTVMLTSVALTREQRYEIYIGDEFMLNDVRHIDVVIREFSPEWASAQKWRPQRPSVSAALPAVLVFEKASAQMVQHELNGLGLETVVTIVASPDCLSAAILPAESSSPDKMPLISATTLPATATTLPATATTLPATATTLPATVTSKAPTPEPVAAEVMTRRQTCCAGWMAKRNASSDACQRRF